MPRPSTARAASAVDDILRLKLSSGGLIILVFDPRARRGSAISLDRNQAAPRELTSALTRLRTELAVEVSSCEVKIVGNADLVAQARAHLGKNGIACEFRERTEAEILFYPTTGRVRINTETPSVIARNSRIRVLIVDDSPTIRKMLTAILEREPSIEIVAATGNPSETEALVLSHRPDVVTVDIHMPEISGVDLVKQLAPKYRLPMIMITSASIDDGGYVLEALENGAFDYIQKPSLQELPEVAPLIIEKVKAAASARLALGPSPASVPSARSPRLAQSMAQETIIAIGSSTGGTEALKEVLTRMPDDIPPTLIVQHIPAVFSKAFASRLNELCAFEVKEAADGDELRRGRVLIAPGGYQVKVVRHARGHFYTELTDEFPVNRHKPSVDVLFRSLAALRTANPIGVVLTGMGNDGAAGLLDLKKAGARTIAQSEATCVVFGMPREAIKAGGVDHVVDLVKIPEELLGLISKPRA